MTFGKSIVLAFGLSLATLQAASAAPIVHVLQCRSTTSGPDHGLSLVINHDISQRNTFATLKEQTFAGPRTIATYSFLKTTDRRPVDGDLTYSGRGFRIVVPSARPPVRPVSRLRARLPGSNGRLIATDMYCLLPR